MTWDDIFRRWTLSPHTFIFLCFYFACECLVYIPHDSWKLMIVHNSWNIKQWTSGVHNLVFFLVAYINLYFEIRRSTKRFVFFEISSWTYIFKNIFLFFLWTYIKHIYIYIYIYIHLPRAGRRIVRFIYFPRILAQCETQTT